MNGNRFLGIDYGIKRIGVAISDENGRLAFPKEIVLNNQNSLTRIGEIIKTENISAIVVGDSVDLMGKENPISKEITSFISKLESDLKLPVYKEKEFLTSVEARGREGKEKNNAKKIKKTESVKVDASAAALILQRYLDKRNNVIIKK